MTAPEKIKLSNHRSIAAPFFELHQSIPSRIDAIPAFVDQFMCFIRRFMDNFRNAQESQSNLEITLREALLNAVIHGNHENPRTQVHVTCRCSMDGEVSITVRDEEKGLTVA